MTPGDVVSYAFLALSWGLSFLVLLHVVAAFGWIGAVAFRALVAGALLLGVGLATRRKLDFRFGWRPLAVVGSTTVAGQLVGLSYGTPRIGTAMAAILVACIPLFSMAIGRVCGLERLSRRGLAGLALGFAGVAILVGFPARAVDRDFLVGCGATLLAALSAAIGSLYASVKLRRAGSWEVSTGSFLFAGATTLPFIVLAPVPAWPKLSDYGYLFVLGGVMSALNYVLYFRLVSRVGATRAISVEFAVTVVAVLVGAIALHEQLTPAQIVGAGVIVCGCALVLGIWRAPASVAGPRPTAEPPPAAP
jgi:drug/metabolite transporter (DMT)-like permease